MARQRGTSGRRVASNGRSGAVGVTSRGEPGAEGQREEEVEEEAGGVPLTLRTRPRSMASNRLPVRVTSW